MKNTDTGTNSNIALFTRKYEPISFGCYVSFFTKEDSVCGRRYWQCHLVGKFDNGQVAFIDPIRLLALGKWRAFDCSEVEIDSITVVETMSVKDNDFDGYIKLRLAEHANP